MYLSSNSIIYLSVYLSIYWEIYIKELAHMIVEADKSKICMASHQAGNSGKISMLQSWGRIPSLENLRICSYGLHLIRRGPPQLGGWSALLTISWFVNVNHIYIIPPTAASTLAFKPNNNIAVIITYFPLYPHFFQTKNQWTEWKWTFPRPHRRRTLIFCAHYCWTIAPCSLFRFSPTQL